MFRDKHCITQWKRIMLTGTILKMRHIAADLCSLPFFFSIPIIFFSIKWKNHLISPCKLSYVCEGQYIPYCIIGENLTITMQLLLMVPSIWTSKLCVWHTTQNVEEEEEDYNDSELAKMMTRMSYAEYKVTFFLRGGKRMKRQVI